MTKELSHYELYTQIKVLMLETPSSFVRPSGFEVDDCNLFLYVDSSRIPHFLIPISDEINPLTNDETQTVRVETQFWQIGSDTEPVNCIDTYLTGNSESLIKGFCTLIHYVLSEISQEKLPRDAMEDALDSLTDFFKVKSKRLSRAAEIGLFGELLWLKRFAQINAEATLGIWAGDNRSSKDFYSTSNAIEIKTTVIDDNLTVKINSHQQLTPGENQNLYLVLVRLKEEFSDDARTVPSLIDDLIDLGIDKNLLLDRLANSDTYPYLEIDRDLYKGSYFAVDEELVFSVIDGFPAITTNDFDVDLLKRIEGLQYSISLKGLEQYQVPLENHDDLLQSLLMEGL